MSLLLALSLYVDDCVKPKTLHDEEMSFYKCEDVGQVSDMKHKDEFDDAVELSSALGVPIKDRKYRKYVLYTVRFNCNSRVMLRFEELKDLKKVDCSNK